MSRATCELCKEKPAVYGMKNRMNGNKLAVCCCCYTEVWGKEGSKDGSFVNPSD
ncbi:hypothetical protein [Paenibacillus sp. OSY-SE]|uniref:hypothetical protein n=1 Tax=Paenibacillus sp. OSY-SE TaxID=1196323 RepID=UPI0002D8494B|nr:hypothetical protein [Paenibacillus sp. OSY-SE]